MTRIIIIISLPVVSLLDQFTAKLPALEDYAYIPK